MRRQTVRWRGFRAFALCHTGRLMDADLGIGRTLVRYFLVMLSASSIKYLDLYKKIACNDCSYWF